MSRHSSGSVGPITFAFTIQLPAYSAPRFMPPTAALSSSIRISLRWSRLNGRQPKSHSHGRIGLNCRTAPPAAAIASNIARSDPDDPNESYITRTSTPALALAHSRLATARPVSSLANVYSSTQMLFVAADMAANAAAHASPSLCSCTVDPSESVAGGGTIHPSSSSPGPMLIPRAVPAASSGRRGPSRFRPRVRSVIGAFGSEGCGRDMPHL